MNKPPITTDGWYSVNQLALVFDWSVSYFNQSVRDYLLPSDVRVVSGRKLYRARSIIDLLTERAQRQKRSAGPHDGRILAAKADREEASSRLALLEETRQLGLASERAQRQIPLGELEEALQLIRRHLHGVAVKLGKRATIKGEDAQETLNSALEAIETEAEASLTGEGDNAIHRR